MLMGWMAGCATAPEKTASTSHSAYKVGKPYQIGDTWYYPREQTDYDETGIASWYGPTFYGKPTANGELFDGEGLTAAHRTLPLPVNVRVTNLDNGKSLVVRVNDRGPFARGRIIDVSKHAAELLGFYARGTARVRVTYLGRADAPDSLQPDETPAAIASAVPAAPAGKVAVAALDGAQSVAPPSPVQMASLEPPPRSTDAEPAQNDSSVAAPEDSPPVTADQDEPTGEVTTVPVPKTTHLYVQAGAFSSRENADRLKDRLAEAGELFVSATDRKGKRLYRVRSGPYNDVDAANAALAKLDELGNNDARIVVDR
jgi:rare lipoprotein A